MVQRRERTKPGPGRLEGIRSEILALALKHAAKSGWNERLLKDAARDAGIGREDLGLAFPDGVGALLSYFCSHGDQQMCAVLASHKMADLPIRERIRLGVITRLDIDRDHKPAVRQAVAAFAAPGLAAFGARALYRTADHIWRVAGDDARDYNRYTKRAMLAGIFSATIMVWLSDKTADQSKTHSFLDARIEEVMAFEKTKARFRDIFKSVITP